MAKKQVVKAKSTAVSTDVTDLLSQYAGAGQASAKHTTIPYLTIVQAISDVMKEGNPKYNPDAKQGMFLDGLSKQLLSNSLIIIPICFRSVYTVLDGAMYPKTRYRKGKMTEQDGFKHVQNLAQEGYHWIDGDNIIEEEYEVYMMVLDEAGETVVSRYCVSFASTKMKKARALNSLAKLKTFPDGREKPFFAAKYIMTTTLETNKDSDQYHNFEFFDHEDVTEPELLRQAISFYEGIEGGEVAPDEGEQKEAKDDKIV